MERVRFGRTGLMVSPISMGTWQLSPRFWGEIPEKTMIDTVHRAFELGINFFDSADAYGDGHGETVLGKAIKGLQRDEIVICTKVFNHFNPDKTRYPDLSPAHVRERCEIELGRLGIETIDLYLIHFPDPLTPLEEIAGVMEELKAAGKIRHYGVSNHGGGATAGAAGVRGVRRGAAGVQPRESQGGGGSVALLPGGGHRGDGVFADAQGAADGEIQGRRDVR